MSRTDSNGHYKCSRGEMGPSAEVVQGGRMAVAWFWVRDVRIQHPKAAYSTYPITSIAILEGGPEGPIRTSRGLGRRGMRAAGRAVGAIARVPLPPTLSQHAFVKH